MSETGERVRALKAAEVKNIDIAHRLGVAQSTVHYHLREWRETPDADPTDVPATPPPGNGLICARTTRERVAELIDSGVRRAEIARRLGVSKSTVSYHARRLGREIDARATRRYDWAVIQEYYDRGHSVRECARAFGFSSASWQDAAKRGAVTPRPAFKPLDEIFAPGTKRDRGHLKIRLLQAGLKEHRCEECGLTEWRGRPIVITLHHVNGDRHDNRIDNLRFLCGNCHSLTDNFAGRNSRRVSALTVPNAIGAPSDEAVRPDR